MNVALRNNGIDSARSNFGRKRLVHGPLVPASQVVAELRETGGSKCSESILIEVQSLGRDTLEQLTLIRDQQPTAVVLITQDEEAQSIKSAVESGVCAYTADGISATKVRPVIEIAMATFQKFKHLRGELAQAKEELNNHKRIDRAKSLLMRVRGLSEDEAHKALRKLSMDRKRKLADVAEDILAMAKLFTDGSS